ncbi:MAG: peptidase MA family metallohydrolase, partial [Thermomicrobiales bacterium]
TDYLPSGIDLVYFWRLSSGTQVIGESEPDLVSWHDSRFEWSTYATAQIQLHTYHLSEAFAASVASTAQQTVTLLEARFAMQPGLPISIWIYQNATDFAAAKQLNSREAVAGASYPGYYVIHLVLREGDDREVGRTVTHEVSHQCLFQAIENPYSLAPLWFDEGMATHSQTAGMDSYLPLAITSANAGSLYKLDSLSAGFPFLPSEAAIAYATSWSAIAFIIDRWGDDGISRLIAEFARGMPPKEAIQTALGISAEDLDLALGTWLRDRA